MSRIIHHKAHQTIKLFRKAPAALSVLMVYISRQNKEGVAWPSLDGLARDTSWGRDACLEARRFLVERGALKREVDYIRPSWRELEPAAVQQRRNLDRAEYYRPTGTITDERGVIYPVLYGVNGEESDTDADPSTVDAIDYRQQRPELDLSSTEGDTNKTSVAAKTAATLPDETSQEETPASPGEPGSPEPTAKPKKPRQPDPVFDMVAGIWFGAEDKSSVAAIAGRIGHIVAWLKGKQVTLRNGSVVPGCEYQCTPQQLLAAREAWKKRNPNVSLILAEDKVIAYLADWLARQNAAPATTTASQYAAALGAAVEAVNHG